MANTLNLGDGNWATKEDSLLGYNSENNNYKPLPFDFSRSSSATRINKDGLIETVGSGKPRIDFLGNTKGALLLEPQRTNLVLTSASGTYGNSPASEANTTSPDGTNNAVIPIPDSTSDRYGYSISSGAYATNTKLAYSWYKKRISTPIDTSFLGDLEFKILVNVTQVGSTTQIQSDVNGFDRFQAIFNITDGSASSIIRGYFGNIIGVGNSSVAYFGHQVEVGSYATSYIPTVGSAVTRIAEATIGNLPSSSIGQSEGVVYFEGSYLDTSEQGYIQISDGTSNNRIIIWNLTSTSLRGYIVVGGAAQAQITGGIISNNTTFKAALKYKTNDFALWVNGVEVGVDPNGSTFGSNVLNKLDLQFPSVVFEGEVKDLKLYNTVLTNEELQALTTI